MDLNTVRALLKISTGKRDLKSNIILQLIMLNKIEIERFSVEAGELDFAIRDLNFFVHSINIAILICNNRSNTEAHRYFILCCHIVVDFAFIFKGCDCCSLAGICSH